MVPVVIASSISISSAPYAGAAPVSPIQISFAQFYPWVMLFLLIFAVITVYGRTFADDSKAKEDQAKAPEKTE